MRVDEGVDEAPAQAHEAVVGDEGIEAFNLRGRCGERLTSSWGVDRVLLQLQDLPTEMVVLYGL